MFFSKEKNENKATTKVSFWVTYLLTKQTPWWWVRPITFNQRKWNKVDLERVDLFEPVKFWVRLISQNQGWSQQ